MTHADGDMRTVVIGEGEEVSPPSGTAPALADRKKAVPKKKVRGKERQRQIDAHIHTHTHTHTYTLTHK